MIKIYVEDLMNADEMKVKLANYLAKDVMRQPGRTIQSDEALLSSGLIDSFHLVDLALFVEDNFGVRIDDSELNASTFDTLDGLIALIQSRQ
ncbi:MAG: acyl carrier protein [Anaerolineales bacterium]|jgi:acyl carrier protein